MNDSQVRRHVLVLTGPYAGKSGTFNGYKFEGGKCVLLGTDAGVAGAKRYFARTYRAYPEGSPELAEAQAADEARKEAANGKREAHPAQHDPASGSSDGDVRPDGSGPSPAQADDGAGDGDASEGAPGSVPGGDGHGDAGLPPQEPQPKQQDDSQQGTVISDPKLLKAVDSLDPENDDHWTQAGLPKLTAVEEAYGEAVTRQMVKNVAPDLDRDVAKAKASEDALKDLA